MFQLRMEEIPDSSKSQIVTLNERGNKRGSNIKKFRFKLTKEKFENLRFQTGTSSESYGVFLNSRGFFCGCVVSLHQNFIECTCKLCYNTGAEGLCRSERQVPI